MHPFSHYQGITSSVGSYNRPHTPSIQSTAHPHYVPTVNHSTSASGAPTPHTSGLGSGIKGQHSYRQQVRNALRKCDACYLGCQQFLHCFCEFMHYLDRAKSQVLEWSKYTTEPFI